VVPVTRSAAVVCLLLAGCAGAASGVHAQSRPGGHVSLTFDALPNAPVEALELRARVFLEQVFRPIEPVRIHVAGYVDGLLADRGERVSDAVARPLEAYVEVIGARADLRVGLSRIVWGRLDEIQPGDVVNPLDLSRFFFDGRAEARLPVALARGRLFFGERATLEGVIVPHFRRGRFDQLDEPSSPFNLAAGQVVCLGIGVCPPLEVEVVEPSTSMKNLQGGGRLSATTRRVDWAVSAWRGFEPFGQYEVLPPDPLALSQVLQAVRTFPRFTMVAGDFETAFGNWGLRGEVAAFRQAGRDRVEAGLGVDRRAGRYHVGSDLVISHFARSDPTVSLIGIAERSFARERYRTRAFIAANLTDRATFARNITTIELRQNLSLEGSVGWFFGEGPTGIWQFTDRDFLYVRLKGHF
jgi:hypothetical protein